MRRLRYAASVITIPRYIRALIRTLLFPALLVIVSGTVAAQPSCTLERLIELPMEANDANSPVVTIKINDQPRRVLLDTGGFWSLLDPQAAAGFKTRRTPVSGMLGLEAIPLTTLVVAPSIEIGPVRFSDVEFFVSPPSYFGAEGTLGANVLQKFDVEIDPVSNKASFFTQKHCEGGVVYWPHQDVAEIPVEIDKVGKLITIPVILNGKQVRALIDTGAPETVINLATAERLFGINLDSPGIQRVKFKPDEHGKVLEGYRYQFQSLEMGDVAFQRPWLTVAHMAHPGTDMILGMHQLHGLHLYFAYGERKLYVTTARGDLSVQQAVDTGKMASSSQPPGPIEKTNARDYLVTAVADLQKNDKTAAMTALNAALEIDPNFAQAYLVRSTLYLAQNQLELALKDADKVISADPANAGAYVQRGQIHWQNKDLNGALADIGHALEIDPRFVPGYTLRAAIYMSLRQNDAALDDASSAVAFAPSDPGVYMMRGRLYELGGALEPAYEDADKVVKLRPKSAAALNSRCWLGALTGRLQAALADCNAAIALVPRNAAFLDSRAFVHFRLALFNIAQDDYSAALAVNPKLASSLYGRGLARQQKGDAKGAAMDIAAARAIDPGIADHFGK